MGRSSTLSDSSFNESSQLTSTYDNLYNPSMFFTTTAERFYHDYQYNLTSISISNYLEYSTNNENIFPYQPPQEQMGGAIKIYINPFFRPLSLNRTNESLCEIKQQQQEGQHNSSISSRSQSRSPVTDRQVKKSSIKKRQDRQRRKEQREKLRREKELIYKRQSSTKPKHQQSSPDRWEHKQEKFKRLYKEYFNEDTFIQWKPLVLKDCFELYNYAFEKHYGTSINNKN